MQTCAPPDFCGAGGVTFRGDDLGTLASMIGVPNQNQPTAG